MKCAPKIFFGLVLGGLSLGRNFAEFQKIRVEGDLAKFAIARLCGHFRSRGLQQIVVRCLHFKCIVFTSAGGFFFNLVFGRLSLNRNFAEFQKMRDKCDLAKFAVARLCGHFRSRGLQLNVVLCLHFKRIVIRR